MLNAWDEAANTRKDQIESGVDLTFSKIFVPYYIDLVQRLRPKVILEVGCGTGHLSLALSPYVDTIDAIEPSKSMYAIAANILKDTNVKTVRSSAQQFTSKNNYDMIISHMCAQTVTDLKDFFLSIRKVANLKTTCCFSLPHPCFYNAHKKIFKDEDYQYSTAISKNIDLTITTQPNRLIKGIPYHHRPLSKYIKGLKDVDMCLIDMDEIIPDKGVQSLYGSPWKNPRYLVLHASLIL